VIISIEIKLLLQLDNKEQHKEEARYQNRLIPVAWAILIMGISLAVVILLYVWIGHIGPTYSSDTLQGQQQELRQQYPHAH
jgi:hypothetical protein